MLLQHIVNFIVIGAVVIVVLVAIGIWILSLFDWSH